MAPHKPPYDPELLEVYNATPLLPPLTKELVVQVNGSLEAITTVEATMTDPEITHEEINIPGHAGKLSLSILRKKNSLGGQRPVIYYIHGGGLIIGNKLINIQGTFEWIKELDAVVVTVEYRLAPEHPYPAAIDDCYAGLLWVAANSRDLGINLERLILAGNSAGGGLAAALALLVRDKGGPKILAQCLIYPMLDDRMETVSSKQFMNEGTWMGVNNIKAWDWYIPGIRGKKDVPIYAAPSRATDLTGLPQTWLDVGGAELFRDEDTEYAMKLAEFGVPVEFHIWPGSWHGSDMMAPDSLLSKTTNATRLAWFKRILAHADGVPKKTFAKL